MGKLGTWVVIVALCPLGCGGDKGTDPVETSSQAWCGGICTAQRRCGDVRTPESCLVDCILRNPWLASVSTAGAAAEKPCLAKLSCQVFGDDTRWQTENDACWQNAKPAVEVTPHVRAFCADFAEAWFECGSWFSTEDCEHDYGMWSPSVVDRVARCMAGPTCTAFNDCVSAIFKAL
jgi:hypothetical protein